MSKLAVITGGKGDIAQAIKKRIESEYTVYTPGKEELDVTDIASVDSYFRGKNVDLLVNNAGYVVPMSIAGCDIESEKKAIEINLFGVFNCTRSVLSGNRYAKIINIGSSAATKVHGTWSSYCASKAGVVMATMCWAADGVDVVCVSPGRTATKMRRGLYPDEDPGTLLKPDDFAAVVYKAIHGCYERGRNIDVNISNVEELLDD